MTPRHLLEPGRLAGAALLKAQSDGRLVDLTRAGNDRAFEAIVDRYNGQLLRYCSRILPDGRGEDAVQQTFLKAYDAIHADTTPLSLRSWLFGIAHNVALNILRQRGSDHEPLSELDRVDEPAYDTFERRERFREVLAAVAALPAGQREALLLRELEGRGHDEIARELGVTGGAARQLISRARSGIRGAAAAVVPFPLVMRLTDGTAGPPNAERLAELTVVGTGVTVTKVVATAAVGGTLLGGAVTAPDLVEGGKERRSGDVAQAAPAPAPRGSADVRGDDERPAPDRRERRRAAGDDEGRRGRSGDDRDRREDRSGPGGGGDDDFDDDNSGPGSDDDRADDDDNSGPGSGSDDDGTDDSSGPSDSSGPGSGGGDLDDDNSGPGSGGDDLDELDVIEPDDAPDPERLEDADNSGPGNAED